MSENLPCTLHLTPQNEENNTLPPAAGKSMTINMFTSLAAYRRISTMLHRENLDNHLSRKSRRSLRAEKTSLPNQRR